MGNLNTGDIKGYHHVGAGINGHILCDCQNIGAKLRKLAKHLPKDACLMGQGKGHYRLAAACILAQGGPHHSIGNADHGGIDYSTFLEYSDFILAMAQKYKDDIQMAFKPHPLLRKNLLAYWNEDKINEYYKRWDEYENTQLELGGYKGLFMHSDAMIHDSGSFTIEYHYTHKPVMYLVKNDKHTDNQNEFAVQAYNLHYKGHNEEEIEKFICDVIAGCDPQYDERKKFFEESLLPPNGKTAAQNIIDAILGC